MFKEFTGYHAPAVEKINTSCEIATYLPLTKGDVIVGISTSNKDNKGIIYLYSNTIINISNNIILSLLNNIPKNTKKVLKGKKARKKK